MHYILMIDKVTIYIVSDGGWSEPVGEAYQKDVTVSVGISIRQSRQWLGVHASELHMVEIQ